MRKTAPARKGLIVAAGLLVSASLWGQGFGVVDVPRANQVVSGIVKVNGWVLSHSTTQAIDLLIDRP